MIDEADTPLPELRCRLQRPGQPAAGIGLDDDAVDDHVEATTDELLRLDLVEDQGVDIDTQATVAAALDLGDAIRRLAGRRRRRHRRHNDEARSRAPAGGPLQHLLEGVHQHVLAALQAVGLPHAGPQQAQGIGQACDGRRRRP